MEYRSDGFTWGSDLVSMAVWFLVVQSVCPFDFASADDSLHRAPERVSFLPEAVACLVDAHGAEFLFTDEGLVPDVHGAEECRQGVSLYIFNLIISHCIKICPYLYLLYSVFVICLGLC